MAMTAVQEEVKTHNVYTAIATENYRVNIIVEYCDPVNVSQSDSPSVSPSLRQLTALIERDHEM